MKYTNKNNFHHVISKWLKNDLYEYEEGVISATTLLKPVQAVKLYEQYKEHITVDVEEVFNARVGTAIHESFAKLNMKGYIQELRLYSKVQGQRISGQFDFMQELPNNQYMLEDLKTTSVWTYIFESNVDITTKQLSIYRWLAHKNGFDVIDKANILYMFVTDYNNAKARQGGDYPKHKFAVKPVTLMSLEDTEQMIVERLNKLNSNTVNRCNNEELWKGQDVYKVMKNDNKRSVKNCDTYDQAESHVKYLQDIDKDKGKRNKYYIDFEPGLVSRCPYCDVRPFCNQYKELLQDNLVRER